MGSDGGGTDSFVRRVEVDLCRLPLVGGLLIFARVVGGRIEVLLAMEAELGGRVVAVREGGLTGNLLGD